MSRALVIIPTYNEGDNILPVVDAVMALEVPFDVLVVDDNSPDDTAGKVRQLMSRYNSPGSERIHLLERSGKLGLGTAYLEGFRWALQRDTALILQMDADFSHNPSDLPRLRAACADGADLAIGSRYITGVNVVNWPMGRVLLSWFASAYVRLITRLPVQDATAGFVCYRRHVLETILQSPDPVRFVGYAFQIEMKFLTWKYGFRMVEVPIVFTDRTRGASKMSAGIFQEAFFGVIRMVISGWFRKFIPLPRSGSEGIQG